MQCTFWRRKVSVLAATCVVVVEQPVTVAHTFFVNKCHDLASFGPHFVEVMEMLFLDLSYLSNGIGFGGFAQALPSYLDTLALVTLAKV
eukprot:1654326-Pleurochrysis_carterae.AAC.1